MDKMKLTDNNFVADKVKIVLTKTEDKEYTLYDIERNIDSATYEKERIEADLAYWTSLKAKIVGE